MALYLYLAQGQERNPYLYRQIPRGLRVRESPLDYLDDEEIIQKYRLNRQTIVDICGKLNEILSRRTRRSNALSVSTQVLAALRYFATGSFQAVTGDTLGISRFSVSRSVHSVASGIVAVLMDRHLTFPTTRDATRREREGFYDINQFPNVLGTVDGVLIPVIAPSEDENLYFSHKGYHALNVQGVVGHDGQFTNIVARWPGATHDALIWRNCFISQQFEEGHIQGGWLLGDSAYALKPWLLTPLLRPRTRAEIAYNRAHKKTRSVCERAFGVWKSRWRCLHKTGGCMMFSPERCIRVIVATAVLHNICVQRRLPEPEEDADIGPADQDVDDVNVPLDPPDIDGLAVRNDLIAGHFSDL